ncbi:hypothetical protein CIB84_017209, partial [Bambusicola thoracicus]
YFLLTVMSYDRYVAICKPLHYGTLLGSRTCASMAATAWGTGVLYSLLHTISTFSIPLCHGNAVDQFFCEIAQILKLSCSVSDYLRETGIIAFSFSFVLGCFVFILFSYVQIFRAVLRMPSEQGRHKAFSTCLPHLAMLSLFLSTVMFAYMKPLSISSRSLDLVVSFLYSVVPPTVNPCIYSMRNQELKDAVKTLRRIPQSASLWLQAGAAMRTNVSELASLASTTITQGAAQSRDLEASSKADVSNAAKESLSALFLEFSTDWRTQSPR